MEGVAELQEEVVVQSLVDRRVGVGNDEMVVVVEAGLGAVAGQEVALKTVVGVVRS